MILAVSPLLLLAVPFLTPSPCAQEDARADAARLAQEWVARLLAGDLRERSAASHRLAEIGAPAVAPVLAALEKSRDGLARAFLLGALRGMGEDAAPAVPALRRLITASDPSLRGLAIDVLGRIGPNAASPAIPDIRRCWDDPSPPVRRVAIAVTALLAEPAPGLADALAERLRAETPEEREGAAHGLGLLGSVAKEQLEPLLGTMRDPVPAVRRAAAESVGKLGDEGRAALLDFAREADDLPGRKIACHALAHMRPVRGPQLSALLGLARDPALRKEALTGLREMGAPAAVAQMDALETGLEPELGKEILENLGASGEAAHGVVPRIAKLLDSAQPLIRFGAAVALAQIGKGGPDVISRLSEAIRDELMPVRIYSLIALARLGRGSRGVLPRLIALLRERDDEQSFHVVQALRIYRAEALPALEPLLECLESGGPRMRIHGSAAIAAIGPAALPRLREALGASSVPVRVSILRAIGRMGSSAREAKAWVEPLLEHESDELCVAAVRCLALLGNRDADLLSKFAALLHRDDADVRIAALSALGRLGGDRPELGVRIARLFEASDGGVRRAAAEALGAIGDARVVPQLLSLLDTEEEHLRWRLVRALGAIGEREQLGTSLREVVEVLSRLERSDPSAYVRPEAREALRRIRGG